MSESKMASAQGPGDELPRPGMTRLKGLSFPWMVTQECLDAVKDYEIWEDDVWVITYPKSGTHWALEIVNLIQVDGCEGKINRNQQAHGPEFDYSIPGMTASSKRPSKSLPEYKIMQGWKSPRTIMTHVTEELMPAQIYQGKGKAVFVIRNPKDIAVSLWHFAVAWKFNVMWEDWDYFLDQYLAGECFYGSWFHHTLNFWSKHRYDKNFLFLKYEDMKEDIKGAIIQIADFLGKPLSEEAINRIIEFSSVKSMKQRFHVAPSSPKTDDCAPSRDRAPIGAPAVMRKGIVGDWKSQFTVAQNEAFDALYQEKMAGSELNIRFE